MQSKVFNCLDKNTFTLVQMKNICSPAVVFLTIKNGEDSIKMEIKIETWDYNWFCILHSSFPLISFKHFHEAQVLF